jgi:hypothetical protein
VAVCGEPWRGTRSHAAPTGARLQHTQCTRASEKSPLLLWRVRALCALCELCEPWLHADRRGDALLIESGAHELVRGLEDDLIELDRVLVVCV